jgi:SAM-dependent methyltransferase
MSLYNRILGMPWIYNTVRPLVVGGIDMSCLYDALEATERDVILDVGCGTGDALNYIGKFRKYHGFDIDGTAVAYARKKFGHVPNVVFENKILDGEQVENIAPTKVVLAGLLHHLSDREVDDLFQILARSARLSRLVTQDIVHLPGEFMSNLFARLDRGRFCRKEEEYKKLIEDRTRGGFRLVSSSIVKSHPVNGRAKYLIMVMDRK